MEVWIDAQLPPSLASALRKRHGADAKHVLELGLASARDEVIFAAARSANAIIVTKDADFVRIQEREGPPPKILWVTLGNVRNSRLNEVVLQNWPRVMGHLEQGERLVEIGRQA